MNEEYSDVSECNSSQVGGDSSIEPDNTDSTNCSTCIVCNVEAVHRAILPCRHVSVCETCFPKVNACPMCRGRIESSFLLRSFPSASATRDSDEVEVADDELENSWWLRFNTRLNRLLGME